jgi:hypothetical protein
VAAVLNDDPPAVFVTTDGRTGGLPVGVRSADDPVF